MHFNQQQIIGLNAMALCNKQATEKLNICYRILNKIKYGNSSINGFEPTTYSRN